MPESKKYVLDQDVKEYFEFEVFGHSYKFRYPTTEELVVISELAKKKDVKGMSEYIDGLISKTDKKAPSMKKIEKRMTSPMLRKFHEMIRTELGIH